MAGKIIINLNHCKGCGVCFAACPKKCIVKSTQPNPMGYFPAEFQPPDDNTCIACTLCAIVCPDAAITVLKDESADKNKTAASTAGNAKGAK